MRGGAGGGGGGGVGVVAERGGRLFCNFWGTRFTISEGFRILEVGGCGFGFCRI